MSTRVDDEDIIAGAVEFWAAGDERTAHQYLRIIFAREEARRLGDPFHMVVPPPDSRDWEV